MSSLLLFGVHVHTFSTTKNIRNQSLYYIVSNEIKPFPRDEEKDGEAIEMCRKNKSVSTQQE